MVEYVELIAKLREKKGSTVAKRLRKRGIVPLVLNRVNGENLLLQASYYDLHMLLSKHRSEQILVNLKIEGMEGPLKTLLKDVQHDPVHGRIIHADFIEISADRKIRVRIMISLKGEPIGVTESGGVLEHILREIEVDTLPDKIVEEIEADVSHLKVGDVLAVRDLKLDPSWVVHTPLNSVVAVVAAPKIEEIVTAAPETAEAPAAPEVIPAKAGEESNTQKSETLPKTEKTEEKKK